MIFNEVATKDLTRRDVDYVCNHETGTLWLLHGKPMPFQRDMKRVHFNPETRELTLLADGDRSCTMPAPVQPPLADMFARGRQITVIWTDKGEIFDVHILPVEAR